MSVSPTPHESPQNPKAHARARQPALLGLMIVVALIVGISHGPALRSQAVSIDDSQYFTTNVLVQNPGWASVRRFLTEVRQPSTVDAYYHPLTMISLMMDYALGARPEDLTIAHVDSLVLHLLTTICVMLLIHQLFRSTLTAAMAALLFGLHPLTVELAVWISQRKAGLAGLFTAVCLLCYVLWIRRRTARWYAASLAALALALLSKPSALPAPFLLLALDFWPLRRLHWRAIVEKIPYFALAAAGGAISVISHASTVFLDAHANLNVLEKAMLACAKVGFFVEKILLPRDLTLFYVVPQRVGLDQAIVVQGIIVVVAMAIWLVALRERRAAAACMAFFLLALGPVLGFVGYSEVFAFDSYAYIPLIAPTLLLAGGLRWLTSASNANGPVDDPPLRPLPTAIACAAVLTVSLAFIIQNHTYLSHWSDTERLYSHMIRLAPNAPVLHKNLGGHYYRQRDYPRAQRQFETALSLFPADWQNHLNLAVVLAAQGQQQQARDYLRTAAEAAPQTPRELQFLSTMLLQFGLPTEALKLAGRLVALRPDSAAAHFAYATALGASGRSDDARRELQETLRLDPRHSGARAALEQWKSGR